MFERLRYNRNLAKINSFSRRAMDCAERGEYLRAVKYCVRVRGLVPKTINLGKYLEVNGNTIIQLKERECIMAGLENIIKTGYSGHS